MQIDFYKGMKMSQKEDEVKMYYKKLERVCIHTTRVDFDVVCDVN